MQDWKQCQILRQLLIVPYGIETIICVKERTSTYLLIVPYGIETSYLHVIFYSLKTFNRTLWN